MTYWGVTTSGTGLWRPGRLLLGSKSRARKLICRFSDLELDTELRTLSRRGDLVPVQPRVFDLLHHLIENRERIVSRRDLYRSVWPEVKVADTSITQAIKELRRVLGDRGDQPERVRTVRGHGYQFIAEIAIRSSGPGDSPDIPPLVGRDGLVENVLREFEHAAAGQGRAVARALRAGPRSRDAAGFASLPRIWLVRLRRHAARKRPAWRSRHRPSDARGVCLDGRRHGDDAASRAGRGTPRGVTAL